MLCVESLFYLYKLVQSTDYSKYMVVLVHIEVTNFYKFRKPSAVFDTDSLNHACFSFDLILARDQKWEFKIHVLSSPHTPYIYWSQMAQARHNQRTW